MNKILVLGDGQLGSAICQLKGWNCISRKKDGFQASNPDFNVLKPYDQIVNCIGFTKTYSEDRKTNWETNYKFVADLTDFCNINPIKKIVHISTDYVYSESIPYASEEDVPVHCRNWYGYTKLLADGYVQLKAKDFLIVRCSFKPRPFPYPKAITSQFGNFDYTDVITKMICRLVDLGANGVYNVGTEPKTIYELARQTNPNVEPMIGKIHDSMPTDITMDCSKMKKAFGE